MIYVYINIYIIKLTTQSFYFFNFMQWSSADFILFIVSLHFRAIDGFAYIPGQVCKRKCSSVGICKSIPAVVNIPFLKKTTLYALNDTTPKIIYKNMNMSIVYMLNSNIICIYVTKKYFLIFFYTSI